jgi:hypothetical protein
MRKITIAALALTLSGSMAFAQSASKHQALAKRTAAETNEIRVNNTTHQNKPETVIFTEDFSNGIPATWTNIGYDGFGNILDSALWEYRGPNTNPDVTVGSRGAYLSSQQPITSATASNGFVIFDSDYLDNAGVAGNFGNGKAPAPHLGTLTTPLMDFTGESFVQLTFSSYHRYFEGRAIVAFSSDGGTTWPDTIAAHPTLAVNSATSTNDRVGMNISFLGGQDSVRIRFIFDGTYDDPGASGSGMGYYFWNIDDIVVESLPKFEMRFTEWQDAPPQDILFGPAQGSSKMGILTKNGLTDQTRDIEFDCNIYNYGYGSVNNVQLTVDVLDAATGTLVSSFTSTGSVNLASGDTGTYNDLNTLGNPFKPVNVGTYDIVYKAVGDSVTAVSDTFSVFVTDSLMSNDFNVFDNSIGTSQQGDDGSAVANRLDLVQPAIMTGVWVGLSTATVAGATVEIEVFDTVGFDFLTGYPATALVATSLPYLITQDDIDNGFFQVPITDGTNQYVQLASGAYFVAVRMFSNGGTNLIAIANDQTFTQPSFSSIMYNTDDGRWYTGYTNSLTLNGLFIRGKLLATSGIGMEDMLNANIKVGPNPAADFINVNFEDLEGDFTLTLTDITGRVVSVEQVSIFGAGFHTLNVSELSAGVYMLNINNGSASVSHKISVQ